MSEAAKPAFEENEDAVEVAGIHNVDDDDPTPSIRASRSIGALAGALASAQVGFQPIKKDTSNPFYNSKYADLSTIISATQPSMAKNGLVLIQSPIVDLRNQKAGVTSLLAHSSGEWMENELILPATMLGRDGKPRFDAQSVGSAITYARRYTYQSLVGVAAEVDDDANSASGIEGAHQAKSVAAEKLRTHAAGNETVVVKHAEIAGYLALSGPGLPIVMATLDSKAKGKIGMMTKGTTWMIPTNHLGEFVKYCTAEKVAVDESSLFGQDAPKTDSPLTKANIPPAPVLPEPESKSTDPILMDFKELKSKQGKEFAEVSWNGRKHSCWDKGLWVVLKSALKQPVMLNCEEKGKYSNVKAIIRVDGMQLGDAAEDHPPLDEEWTQN